MYARHYGLSLELEYVCNHQYVIHDAANVSVVLYVYSAGVCYTLCMLTVIEYGCNHQDVIQGVANEGAILYVYSTGVCYTIRLEYE